MFLALWFLLRRFNLTCIVIQIKSNQTISNPVESNQISNQIESNRINSNQTFTRCQHILKKVKNVTVSKFELAFTRYRKKTVGNLTVTNSLQDFAAK